MDKMGTTETKPIKTNPLKKMGIKMKCSKQFHMNKAMQMPPKPIKITIR
jgi:hypothetical protein